jgi:hypothetical protein
MNIVVVAVQCGKLAVQAYGRYDYDIPSIQLRLSA